MLVLLGVWFLGAFPVTVASAEQLAGVHAHLLWPQVDGAERRSQLLRLREAGADIVRVDVGWTTLEARGKGEYEQWYLDRMDQLVDEAQALDLKLLFEVTDSPCWASSAPPELKQDCEGDWWGRGVGRYAPTRAEDYADIVEFLVRRFGSKVHAWEVGNEPNLPHYFRADDPAKQYAQMLIAAYDRAKAVDPRTLVVGGALSSADVPFLDRLLAHGIAGHFDAFSAHPYSENSSPMEPFPDAYASSSFVRGVPAIRRALLAAGEDKPLWLTELGWSSCEARATAEWWTSCNSEEEQGRYIEEAFAQVARWPWVASAFVYKAKDEAPRSADRENSFGLLYSDGEPKPAFHAFRRAAVALEAGVTVPGTSAPPEPAASPSVPPPASAPPTVPQPASASPPVLQPAPAHSLEETPTPAPAVPAAPDEEPDGPAPSAPVRRGTGGTAPSGDRALAPASPDVERLRVAGRRVTCRRSCVRHPLLVAFTATRRVPVAMRVERWVCAPRCSWVVRRRFTLMARNGNNAAPLRFGPDDTSVTAGRWRVVLETAGRPRATAGFTVRAVRRARAG